MLEKNLNELNIFALRDLARRTGVNSPTSKKKEQLIAEIVEIVSGKKEPNVAKTKQGRPPKVFGYNFANVFNADESNNLSTQTLKQKISPNQEEETKTVAGWLELVNNNSALLWVENDFKLDNYFIPNELLKNVNVKMGDRVVVEISNDPLNRVVQNVFSVNDYPLKDCENQRLDYCDIEHKSTGRKLEFNDVKFNDLNLGVSNNVYVYGNNNVENTKLIIELLTSSTIENKLYVNVSVTEKNKSYLAPLKYNENFLVNFTDEDNTVRRMVFLATERAKRLLEIGEDVLLVVDDINSIMAVDNENSNLVKSLISLTKDSGKGSITLIAIIPNEGISRIEKLADQRLKIENETIELV